MSAPHLRIATRGSQLALWQAEWVAGQLRALGATVEIIRIATSGDVQQVGPISAVGLQGVFTKEIQAAVLAGDAEIAVHSLKDLPTEQVDGLILAAVPPREHSADALISRGDSSLTSLPAGARVGTGSQRRRAQLLHLRPDIEVLGIRGNVDTRLAKLDDGEYDAIVLAAAGLKRLELEHRVAEYLEPPWMLPAVGQGALGIECRAEDKPTLEILRQLDHEPSHQPCIAERAMLARLHGGCSAPVGAWARMEDERLLLDGLVASLDGKQLLRVSQASKLDHAADLGSQVAEELLAQGAAEIISAAREGDSRR